MVADDNLRLASRVVLGAHLHLNLEKEGIEVRPTLTQSRPDKASPCAHAQ